MGNLVRFLSARQGLLLFVGIGALLPAGVARAQVSTAEIVGTVVDATGAVLAGVKVTAANSATALTRTTVSNESGNFLLSTLPVGHYTVKAETTGFKAYSVSEVALAEGDRLRLDMHMEVGQVVDSIEVRAGGISVCGHNYP